MRSVLGAVFVMLAAAAPVRSQEADLAGYYKSSSRDRVYAFEVMAPVDRAQAEAITARADVSAGAMTRALIYVAGDCPAPADGLTLAPSLQAALALTAQPPFDCWQWRLSVNPAGQRTLVER